jgi:hypothetical protein
MHKWREQPLYGGLQLDAMTGDKAPDESGLENWSEDQFAFLAGYGFVVDHVTQDIIQWRKGDRTIVLSRDWRDGTVDLTFACGTESSDRQRFGLHQALQLVAPEAWPSHGWQGLAHSTTRKYIVELAALVHAHLGAFLDNGADLWRRAGDLARDQALAYWTAQGARQLRQQADAAWKARDWPRVINSYEELQATGVPLKESEVKRLHYARQHA